MRASCDPWGGYTISSCLTYTRQLRTVPEACTFQASTCTDVDDCIGRGLLDETESTYVCADATTDWICDGDLAFNCDDSPYAFDCAAIGATCSPYADGATDTGMPPCKLPVPLPETPCEEAPGGFHCSDNTLYECIDGVRYGWDCGTRTSTCIEGTDGDAYCRESETFCDAPGTSSCSGSQLYTCADDGMEVLSDCSTGNLTCSDQDYCIAPGCEIEDVDNCAESCVGSSLQVCVGGSPLVVACSDFGFTTCNTFESEGLVHAYCEGETGGGGGFDTCVGYTLNDVCDEPEYCAYGTDTTDCYLAPAN
jgi:hypothetical protein